MGCDSHGRRLHEAEGQYFLYNVWWQIVFCTFMLNERSLQLYCSSVPIKCKLNASQTCFLLNKQFNSVLTRLDTFKCAVSLLGFNFQMTFPVLYELLSRGGSVDTIAGHFPEVRQGASLMSAVGWRFCCCFCRGKIVRTLILVLCHLC